LTNAKFARDSGNHPGQILNWNFRMLDGSNPLNTPRAVSEGAKLQVDFVTPQVDLVSRHFRTGMAVDQTIRLQPTLSPVTGLPEVTAFILNMPWPDILGVRPPMTTDRPEDTHFDLFYEMLNPGAAVRRIPFPDPRQHCGGAVTDPDPSASTPQCPPSLYSPNANA
jgi:hypothetical protein